MKDWLANQFQYELNLNPVGWAGVSGMADILMVFINLFLLITVWQGIRNIRETRKSRDAEMMNLVLGQIEAIKPSMSALKEKPADIDWENDPVARKLANDISIGLQRLGYLGMTGMINKQHLMEMWGPTFVSQWNRVAPFVRRIREANGEPPELKDGAFSRKDFEKFAQLSSKYLRRGYKAVAGNFRLERGHPRLRADGTTPE